MVARVYTFRELESVTADKKIKNGNESQNISLI